MDREKQQTTNVTREEFELFKKDIEIANLHNNRDIMSKLDKLDKSTKEVVEGLEKKYEEDIREMKQSDKDLQNFMQNINDNIEKQTEITGEFLKKLNKLEGDFISLEKENIVVKHEIKDLQEFKETTSTQISNKSKEMITLVGTIITTIGIIVAAVISVSHYFF